MAGLLNNVFFGKNLHVWHIPRLEGGITNPVPSGRDANGGQNPVRSQNRFTIPYYLLCAASVVVDFWGPFWQIPRASVKNDPFWTFLDPFWTLAPKPDSDPQNDDFWPNANSGFRLYAKTRFWPILSLTQTQNWQIPKVNPDANLKLTAIDRFPTLTQS